MKRFLTLFLITIFVLFAQSCAAQTAGVAEKADYEIIGGKDFSVLPFELFDNRQLVKVKINGQGPFTFGVDTGGGNLITPELAGKLGLKLTDEFEISGAGEQRVPAWRTRVEKVETGELKATNQVFVVTSLKEIQEAIGFQEFDGLLGRELFNSLTTRIDFDKNQFVFTKPEKFAYKGTGEVIPFEFAGHIPQIEAEIDGIKGKIIVDTGDRSSLTLFVPFYEQNGFGEKYSQRREALTGWGIGGAIPSEMFRLKQIKIGDVILEDVVTRLPLVKSGAFVRETRIASIGSGLLKRFNVIFDYKRRRIILEKNSNFQYEDKFENYVLDKRYVRGNTLISGKLPQIKIVVDEKFRYAGRFDFRIRDVAAGERFVFVDAEKKKVKRLFIAQFEGFLPGVDDFFRYSFANAETFGGHKFRHNNFAFSNKEARENNPHGESVLTSDFLKEKGYELEDELMLSRFLTVPDKEKRNELILFYVENISPTEHTLSEFYDGDNETEIWKRIGKDLRERSLKSFAVK